MLLVTTHIQTHIELAVTYEIGKCFENYKKIIETYYFRNIICILLIIYKIVYGYVRFLNRKPSGNSSMISNTANHAKVLTL